MEPVRSAGWLTSRDIYLIRIPWTVILLRICIRSISLIMKGFLVPKGFTISVRDCIWVSIWWNLFVNILGVIIYAMSKLLLIISYISRVILNLVDFEYVAKLWWRNNMRTSQHICDMWSVPNGISMHTLLDFQQFDSYSLVVIRSYVYFRTTELR